MSDRPVPGPQWPEEELTSALGLFVLAWSKVEGSLEVAISKQLGLASLEGSIVTTLLQFRPKNSILLSLLNLDAEKNRKAIETVKSIQNMGDRNDIMHSVIGANKDVIWLDRRRSDNKFTGKIIEYDTKKLLELAVRCSKMSDQLREQLQISDQDYTDFFHEAHKAVNSE